MIRQYQGASRKDNRVVSGLVGFHYVRSYIGILFCMVGCYCVSFNALLCPYGLVQHLSRIVYQGGIALLYRAYGFVVRDHVAHLVFLTTSTPA